jgi:2-phospho-L-lactate guanylyltransferase
MPDGVWGVVVARVAHGAKSRLAAALSGDERRRLALAMLADVLTVCRRARVLDGTIAVVDDPAAQRVAANSGAVVVDDPGSGDMNAAAAAGIEVACERGAATVIVLPGDVPLITRDDLRALVRAAGDVPRAVVVGASRDGHGTNALLLRPPDVIAPAFGPPSVDRHVRAGVAHAALARVESRLGLSLDVDTPADLAALADSPVGGRTAQVLLELLQRRPVAPLT